MSSQWRQPAPLIQRCNDAYWIENSTYKLDDLTRMEAVLKEIANEIESWAPGRDASPICHLQIKEIAMRLRMESIAHTDPKRKNDFTA